MSKMDKQFIMLAGLPATGKSTWSLPYRNDSDWVILSTDEYIENAAKFQGKTYNEIFEANIKLASKYMNDNLIKAINENKNIIWDQTNLNIKSRKNKLNQIPKDYYKIVIWFNKPNDHTIRLNSRSGKVIPQNILFNMEKSIQIPSLEEGFNEVKYYNVRL